MVDDKTVEEFATYMKRFNDLYEHLALIVDEQISSSHPFILDLGVGPGLLSIEIFRKKPQASIIGIDPLVKMLLLAKDNIKNVGFQKFESIMGISENIPLKSNIIDVIVSRFSLVYWTNPIKSFEEMMRVLKPGGKVILEALNRDFPKWKLLLIQCLMLLNRAGRNVTKYHIDAYKRAYKIEQVKQFLKDTGFMVFEKQNKKNDWKFIILAEKK